MFLHGVRPDESFETADTYKNVRSALSTWVAPGHDTDLLAIVNPTEGRSGVTLIATDFELDID